MKHAIIALVAIIIGVGIFISIPKKAGLPANTGLKTYTSEKYGISFTYPKDYVLLESERGNGERGQYAIALVKEEDSAQVENSEGPTAITINIFQNNLDKQSITNWYNNSSNSNSKIAYEDSLASTTVAGKEAITYKWSGLYEGESVVLEHKENIVMISVTFLSPEDKNIPTYREVLKSIKFN